MQHLAMIGSYQEKGAMIGIATPENMYNTATELTKAAGFPNPDRFWSRPQPQPPKPDPNDKIIQMELQKATIKAKTELQNNAADNFTKKQIAAYQQTGDLQALAAEFQHDKEMALIDHHATLRENAQGHAQDMQKAQHEERAGVFKDLRQHVAQTVAREHGAALGRNNPA